MSKRSANVYVESNSLMTKKLKIDEDDSDIEIENVS